VKKRGLSSKEKKEIMLISGSILMVVIIGVLLQFVGKGNTFAGAAIDPNYATSEGVMSLLNSYTPVKGNGNCNTLCGEMICIPFQNSCEQNIDKNQCYCVNVPK